MRFLVVCFALSISVFKLCAQSITISEINYKSPISNDAGDWFELHNFGSTIAVIDGYTVVDTSLSSIPYTFPTGTSIAPGGYLVVFRKASQFTVQNPSITNKIGPFSFKINGVDEINLRNTSNVVVAKAVISDGFGWPKGGDGEGRTNELVNQNQNTNTTAAIDWRDGCMGGSPGTAPVTCVDPIIFSEINFNSDSILDQGEWVEHYNNTQAPINLTNYYLRDAFDTAFATTTNTYYFPTGYILPTGGYVVVSNDTARTRAYHPYLTTTNLLGNFNYNLANKGEVIKLFDPNFRLVFSVHYNDTIPWPAGADGQGYTLELKQKNGFYNDGANWETGCKLGSPGGPRVAPCKPVYPLSIDDAFLLENVSVSPNPIMANKIFINGFNVNKYTITDVQGRTIQAGNVHNNEINLVNTTNGMYFLKLSNKTSSIVKPISIQ